MKNFNKILLLIMLIIVGLTIFFTETGAVSTGSAICSVSPASGTISQNGELTFTVSSNILSTALDYVYISATNFSNGLYSDLGPGKVIPVGSNSLSFKVQAGNTVQAGNQTFKVNCSTGCPVGGCSGGGSPDVLGSATISLNVSGTNTGGGSGSGSTNTGSCKLQNISLPPNSSSLLNFELPTGASSVINGSIGISGTSNNLNITVTPLFSNISISGGRWQGSSQVVVKTGPNFSGGSYLVTSNINGSKCIAIGNITLPIVTNASGKLKLTAVKSLNPTMFPESGCVGAGMYGTGGGAGCRYGFYGGSGPKIMNYMDSPSIIGGDLMRSTYSRITPTAFTLADPMNPTFSKSGVVTVSSDTVVGEHGMTTAVLSAVSKDGKYSAVKTNYDVLAISTPTKNKTIIINSPIESSASMDIVKYNSSYILLHNRGAINITNPENIEAPLPDGFPSMVNGSKIILGDGTYVAVGGSDSSNVLLYSLSQSEPIATLSIPSRHEKIDFTNVARIPFSEGDYLFTWGSGVNLFKFEYAAKKITWVIKDASYSEYTQKYGRFFDAALSGFDAGNGDIGLVAFTSKGPKAFLLSDIASGKWIDTLVSSPIPTLNQYGASVVENGPHGSIFRNGITYVYSSNNNGQSVNVWKFEANTGSASVGNTGGAPVYPTPPTTTTDEDPNCPGGTVYQTSAGALCVNSSGGVTTTTSYNFTPTTITGGTKYLLPPTNDQGDTLLKEGSKGEKVKDLQIFLNTELSISLTVDGKLGAKTVAAIKQWQNENGLTGDGVVGPKTRELMKSAGL